MVCWFWAARSAAGFGGRRDMAGGGIVNCGVRCVASRRRGRQLEKEKIMCYGIKSSPSHLSHAQGWVWLIKVRQARKAAKRGRGEGGVISGYQIRLLFKAPCAQAYLSRHPGTCITAV